MSALHARYPKLSTEVLKRILMHHEKLCQVHVLSEIGSSLDSQTLSGLFAFVLRDTATKEGVGRVKDGLAKQPKDCEAILKCW